MTRILVMGCLHGNITKELDSKVKKKNFDSVMFLGDLAGEPSLDDIIGKKLTGKKKKQIIISYDDLVAAEYETGIEAMAWLNSLGKPVHVIFGNHDKYSVEFLGNMEHDYHEALPDYDVVMKKFKNLKYVHGKSFNVGGLKCGAYGGYVEIDTYLKSNVLHESPLAKVHRIKRFTMFAKDLSKASRKGLDIFMSHYPAHRMFDKIKNANAGKMNGKNAGFSGYNKVIMRDEPRVFLHSHMHEHQGMRKLGKTLVVSTGASLDRKFVILDINKSKVDVEFY